MTSTVQLGTILIQEGLLLPRVLRVRSDRFSASWRVLQSFDGSTDGSSLGRSIEAAGWSFFFAAATMDSVAFGHGGGKSLRRALGRILARVRAQNFNSAEVTQVAAKRFLGIPYIAVSAHPRHIQKGTSLQSRKERRQDQRQSDWATA